MKHLPFLLVLAIFCISSCNTPKPKSHKIALNMIVKNESQVIERCLNSVLPLIDYWVIVDTGSTDGTQQIIKDFMKKKGIAGELYERPWVNFGHNRQEALDLVKGKADFVFFIDADEYLVYEPNFQLPPLDKDFYFMNISHSGSRYSRIQLINNQLDWHWVGVLHEYVGSSQAQTSDTFKNVYNMYTTEGARSKDPKKYLKDAEILEAGLKAEPHNSRYLFYLAQSYKDAGLYEKALENYEKRVASGGWDQEVFWSLYQVANLKRALGRPKSEVVDSYMKAYAYRPTRIEPLYEVANYFRELGDFHSAYSVGKVAEIIPPSNDLLFVQQWMYDYGMPLELSISAYWTGKFEECQKISQDLLKQNNLHPNVRTCIENNLGFANAKLIEKVLTP